MRRINSSTLRANLFPLFLISTLTGLLFFAQGWVTAAPDKTFYWQQQLSWALTGWYMWAAIFPFLYLFCRHFPLDRTAWKKSIPVHLLAGLILSFLHALTQIKINGGLPSMQMKASQGNIFNGFLVGMIMWRMVIYSALVAVSLAVEYYRKFREGQVLASRIEARILRAQMEALKMQLDPDFLFETLHSITLLMRQDLSAADKMIARLGDFLRLTLDSSGTSQVSLRRELEFLRCYLEIQKIRLHSRVQIDFDIEPATLDARVPNLLLYSMVEEAMEGRLEDSWTAEPLRIRAERVEQVLRLEVTDPHPQPVSQPPDRRNLQERLQQLYGAGFRLTVSTRSDGSRTTIAEIPWSDSEEDHPDTAWVEDAAPAEERNTELEWIRRSESATTFEGLQPGSWWKPYLWSGAAFTALGLFFAARDVLINWFNKEPVDWASQFKWFLLWYIWALAAPYIVGFSRRFPLVRPVILRNILFHVANNLGILFLVSVCNVTYSWLLDPKTAGPSPAFFLKQLRVSDFSVDTIIYWTIVAVGYGASYYREFRRGEIRSARLRAQLARAQIQALKMQLHPHFLFNTLNSISELMQEEIETAEKMMSQLERFLRLTIQNSEAQEVLLETELEFLKCYLEIEHVRFQDRLNVRMEIEPQAMNVPVPNLLLQPIVENAIRHGIAPRSSAGQIDIRAFRTDGGLQVSIQDNGPGIAEDPAASRKGLGLSNTRERLQQLYGKRYRFELANAPGGGLIVTLEIPVEIRA